MTILLKNPSINISKMSANKFLLFLFFITFSFIVNAQTAQKAIYLTNGKILKGQIIEEDEITLK